MPRVPGMAASKPCSPLPASSSPIAGARGLVLGKNRGCLHGHGAGRVRGGGGVDGRGARWIACRLGSSAAGSRARLVQPGRYTELFFLRRGQGVRTPVIARCAECRHRGCLPFGELARAPSRTGHNAARRRRGAPTHERRLDPATRGAQRHHGADGDLPDGAFALADGAPRARARAASCSRGPLPGYTGGGTPRGRSGRGAGSSITPPSLGGGGAPGGLGVVGARPPPDRCGYVPGWRLIRRGEGGSNGFS